MDTWDAKMILRTKNLAISLWLSTFFGILLLNMKNVQYFTIKQNMQITPCLSKKLQWVFAIDMARIEILMIYIHSDQF